MLPHAIRPAQLRALLLLLVLVPLVPTVLLLRLVGETTASEKAAAMQRAQQLHQEVLNGSSASVTRSLAKVEQAKVPEAIRAYYEELFGSGTVVSVAEASPAEGKQPAKRSEAPLAQTVLKYQNRTYDVRLYEKASTADELHAVHPRSYAISAALLVTGILAIAGAAAVAINRQLTLEDLKSTAVATVAHELRTPLASIRMLVDTLREGRCRTAQQQQDYFELIATELARLTRVTEQFLTHSRLERGRHGFHLVPLTAIEIAESAVEILHDRLHAPGCQFRLQLFPDLGTVHGDRSALVMVLVNLLENSLKYTGPEKTVTLRVRAAARAVLFEVMDNGIGMSASEARSVFRPFNQADQRLSRSREGCGLGLSIVAQIVEAHGGRVTVDSKPGRGSCFTVRLPATTPAPVGDLHAPAPAQDEPNAPALRP